MDDRPRRTTAKSTPAKATSAKAPSAKAAPAKKATPARKASPAAKSAKEGAAPKAAKTAAPAKSPATATDPPPTHRSAPAALWPRLRANPWYAPELLARSAVAVYGPPARAWVDRVRRTYPGVTPAAMARLATAEHARYAAGSGALAMLGGLFGPLASAGAVAVLQARLALHIAAAFGADPAAPERAVDLLVLTEVHPDTQAARAALDSADQIAAEDPDSRPGRRLEDVAWRAGVPLLRILGGWSGLRTVGRLVPGAALVLGATADADAVRALAARAVLHYRPHYR